MLGSLGGWVGWCVCVCVREGRGYQGAARTSPRGRPGYTGSSLPSRMPPIIWGTWRTSGASTTHLPAPSETPAQARRASARAPIKAHRPLSWVHPPPNPQSKNLPHKAQSGSAEQRSRAQRAMPSPAPADSPSRQTPAPAPPPPGFGRNLRGLSAFRPHLWARAPPARAAGHWTAARPAADRSNCEI